MEDRFESRIESEVKRVKNDYNDRIKQEQTANTTKNEENDRAFELLATLAKLQAA